MVTPNVKRPIVLTACCFLAVFLLFILWRKTTLSPIERKAKGSEEGEIGRFQTRKGTKELDGATENSKVDFINPFFVVPEQKSSTQGPGDGVTKTVEITADVIDEKNEAKKDEGNNDVLEKNYKPTQASMNFVKGDTDIEKDGEVPQDTNNRSNLDLASTTPTYPSTISDKQEPITALPPLPTFYPSKDLFVRAVYFDDRPRDGHHNTSVFLVVCIRNITDKNLIVGCQVDGREASEFSVKLIGETPLWRAFYNQINHEEVLVHCYDLPVKNGSNSYIMYKMSEHSNVVTAASERPLVIPPPRIKPSSAEGIKYNMTIVTCAKVFNEPPWLEEWLTYQKTLGVDHVHLDVEDSFQQRNGLTRPYIKRALDEGFLSVDVWKRYLGVWEIWYHNQGLVYEDCPYRFRGTYDYIVMLDTDDFFTPREPDQMKLHYYINRYCRGEGVGSCKFRWVEYFPDVFGFSNVSTADGNITRGLTNYSHYNQGNPKSLHRTTVLIDTATHYAYIMMPGYKIVDVSVNIAYVAHIRKFKNELPKNGLVVGLPNICSDHIISKLLVASVVHLVFILFMLLS